MAEIQLYIIKKFYYLDIKIFYRFSDRSFTKTAVKDNNRDTRSKSHCKFSIRNKFLECIKVRYIRIVWAFESDLELLDHSLKCRKDV